MKSRIALGEFVNPDSLIHLNPAYYHAYVLAGDLMFREKEFARAAVYYEQALNKVVATKAEEDYIKDRISDCNQKQFK